MFQMSCRYAEHVYSCAFHEFRNESGSEVIIGNFEIKAKGIKALKAFENEK